MWPELDAACGTQQCALGLLYAAYGVGMHAKFGATGGKLLLKLKLVGQDRKPPSQIMIIKRALVYPGPPA